MPLELSTGVRVAYDAQRREYVATGIHAETRHEAPYILARTVEDVRRLANFVEAIEEANLSAAPPPSGGMHP